MIEMTLLPKGTIRRMFAPRRNPHIYRPVIDVTSRQCVHVTPEVTEELSEGTITVQHPIRCRNQSTRQGPHGFLCKQHAEDLDALLPKPRVSARNRDREVTDSIILADKKAIIDNKEKAYGRCKE